MTAVVGCPVRQRAWVMPTWLEHVDAALKVACAHGTLVFVADPDDETVPILRERDAVVVEAHEPDPYIERQWYRPELVRRMVGLRNRLLERVRLLAPDVFVSVDSDILLHPAAIADLMEGIGRFDAVGGGTFMDPPQRRSNPFPSGHRLPSCGWITANGLRRDPVEHRGVMGVGVIMAVKAMSPAAYGVDYAFNRHGEDVGWSIAASAAGVRLGWDNRHPSKHVMRQEDLGVVDPRCGF